MFKGVYPLYTCYIIKDRHKKILIWCSQVNCTFKKVIDRVLHSTNNFKSHYYKEHKSILICELEAKLKMQANTAKIGL